MPNHQTTSGELAEVAEERVAGSSLSARLSGIIVRRVILLRDYAHQGKMQKRGALTAPLLRLASEERRLYIDMLDAQLAGTVMPEEATFRLRTALSTIDGGDIDPIFQRPARGRGRRGRDMEHPQKRQCIEVAVAYHDIHQRLCATDHPPIACDKTYTKTIVTAFCDATNPNNHVPRETIEEWFRTDTYRKAPPPYHAADLETLKSALVGHGAVFLKHFSNLAPAPLSSPRPPK